MGQPEIPKVYRLSIWRPSLDQKAPEIKVPLASELFLFVENDGSLSPDATAKQQLAKLSESLPPGWEIRATEEPFVVTRGAPAFLTACSRASCPKFNQAAEGNFFCGICGEPLSLTMVATEK